MIRKKGLAILGISIGCGVANAEIHGYPDGPKLPGVTYSVHDPARPQPPAVETSGPVTTQPPSDAVVLFDGKSLDAWEPGWMIKEASMVATG